MYTLVFNKGTLYLIHIGKAANPTHLYHHSKKYRYFAEIMQAVADVEINKKQALIDAAGPDSAVFGPSGALGNSKSQKLSRSEIKEMKVVDSAWKGHHIFLKAGGKKYIFIFEKTRKQEAEEFVKSVWK